MFGQYTQGYTADQASSGTQAPPLPTGEYPVAITKAEMRRPNDQSAWRFLELDFTVQGGQHDGRKVRHSMAFEGEQTDRMTSKNIKLEDLLDEARKQAIGILKAAGHPNPTTGDGAPIEGRRLTIKVSQGKDKEGNKINRVVGWKPAQAQAQRQSQAPSLPGVAARSQAPLNVSNTGEKSVASSPNVGMNVSPAGSNVPNDDIPF